MASHFANITCYIAMFYSSQFMLYTTQFTTYDIAKSDLAYMLYSTKYFVGKVSSKMPDAVRYRQIENQSALRSITS